MSSLWGMWIDHRDPFRNTEYIKEEKGKEVLPTQDPRAETRGTGDDHLEGTEEQGVYVQIQESDERTHNTPTYPLESEVLRKPWKTHVKNPGH